jgi:hypothetical protein
MVLRGSRSGIRTCTPCPASDPSMPGPDGLFPADASRAFRLHHGQGPCPSAAGFLPWESRGARDGFRSGRRGIERPHRTRFGAPAAGIAQSEASRRGLGEVGRDGGQRPVLRLLHRRDEQQALPHALPRLDLRRGDAPSPSSSRYPSVSPWPGPRRGVPRRGRRPPTESEVHARRIDAFHSRSFKRRAQSLCRASCPVSRSRGSTVERRF